MRRLSRSSGIVAAGAFVLLALTACASAAPASGGPAASGDATASLGAVTPAPPEGEVTATGTVLEVGGAAQLCLGPVAESAPPQCSGIPLAGWSWDGVDGATTSGETTWGAYAVRGTYDGGTFTATRPPVQLALYDPIALPDPTGGEPGTGDAATLAAIQDELPDRLGDSYLGSTPQDGWLWVDVVWDDGTWQDAADAEYGDQVVIIRSAIRDMDG
ncbi:hypothetical protein IF188_05135 [Microbacterium sp. NEAU-LLC]|uniref:Uncharacterized protein n=1 Tax=Microbacterium helvum TaxID=2773713 RepID=A0ABR8NK91_9MICO|nr:hypothetical protein [Microbacterium helvum]MBD3941082.1 hypothetical protein [Microbacterium helvum]